MADYLIPAIAVLVVCGIAFAGLHRLMKRLQELRGARARARNPAHEFVELMQKQAAAQDQAHKEEMRRHVNRPLPALTPEDREVNQKASQQCLAVRHVFPPRHPQRSFSFLGGKPLAPDSLDWPLVHNREGLLEPLAFMGQVDCSTIPDGPSRSILPTKGVLYFFAPMAGHHGDEARHFVVRYVPDPPGVRWGEHDHTVLLPPIDGEEARHRFKWMNWRPKADKFYPRYYPRVEIELGWVDYGGEVQPGDPDAETGFPWQVAQARHRASMIAFHGEPIDHDPLLDPRGKPTETVWQPYQDFPSSWRALDIVLGHLRVYLSEERQLIDEALAADATPELEAQKASCERLHKAANDPVRWYSKSELAEPTAEHRERLWALLRSLISPEAPRPMKRHYSHKQLPAVLNEWLSEAAILSAEGCLADPGAAKRIPAEVVNALRWRHAVLKRSAFESDGSYLQHQMMGRGRTVQVAADEMAERYVLLLQLGPDDALGWQMGDNGVMQYWITPADLAARRFDHTVLTFESH
ncbi:MAG TPA: DUF1963 domain-containing protein [Dongiaceae bacterium]|jgi:uncharacterized protein YwqG|nr:DUF1963 domain-containing protein [Dongiaceae bacterium]